MADWLAVPETEVNCYDSIIIAESGLCWGPIQVDFFQSNIIKLHFWYSNLKIQNEIQTWEMVYIGEHGKCSELRFHKMHTRMYSKSKTK